MPMQDLSEVGHQTHESPALSQYQLKSDALKVEPGIAGYPTALVAGYALGKFVFGILSEFKQHLGNSPYIPFVGDQGPPRNYRRSARN